MGSDVEGWLEIWGGCSPDSRAMSPARAAGGQQDGGPSGSVPLAREDEPEICGLAKGGRPRSR